MLSRCRPEGMWCDAALRMMAQNIFSAFGSWPGRRLLLNLSTVSVPVCLFQVDAGAMVYRIDCDVHLQTNEDW